MTIPEGCEQNEPAKHNPLAELRNDLIAAGAVPAVGGADRELVRKAIEEAYVQKTNGADFKIPDEFAETFFEDCVERALLVGKGITTNTVPDISFD